MIWITPNVCSEENARSDRRKTNNWIQPSVMSLPCTDNSDCSSCWSEVSIAGHQVSNVNRKGRDSDAMRWALRAFTLPWLWAPWPKQINIWIRDQQEEKHETTALTVFSLWANSTRQSSIDLTNDIRWCDLLMIHAENNLLTICNNNTNIYLLKPDSASLSQLRSWHDSASPKNSAVTLLHLCGDQGLKGIHYLAMKITWLHKTEKDQSRGPLFTDFKFTALMNHRLHFDRAQFHLFSLEFLDVSMTPGNPKPSSSSFRFSRKWGDCLW